MKAVTDEYGIEVYPFTDEEPTNCDDCVVFNRDTGEVRFWCLETIDAKRLPQVISALQHLQELIK
jgi:hypothetical protein